MQREHMATKKISWPLAPAPESKDHDHSTIR